MNSRTTTWEATANPFWSVAGLALRPLYLGIAFPSLLYLAALTVFLFRPPDLYLFYSDRIVFGLLAFFVTLRTMILQERLPFIPSLSWPMLGLTGLAVLRAVREPFDVQTWSLVASKFLVPFTLFHLSMLVFRGANERKHFEIFVILALAYLAFTAIAFLLDARSLIFPRFILDDSLGIHADRARGPFLQAVANGVSLILLALLAITFSGSRRRLAWLLWLVLPLAVLATMTRAVWIAFVVSTIGLWFRLPQQRLRCACLALVFAGVLGGLAAGLSTNSLRSALWDRTEERGPVDVRIAAYDAGWAMFKERPFTGWTAGNMYDELARRMEGYHLRRFYVHNTYLALLVEFGIPGLALYAILFVNLFRLSWARACEPRAVSLLRRVWPILLAVYLFNAFFVDMAYQFVIGLMFTVAGMLCAAEEAAS